ncbi:MAG: endonuclease/exonuclease/phosphatase family protein [Verrucomicrobiota bacterium]|nr:endonuclease/exonuclease/phosphatase family protein [Verrucomicrobiota bacterium]
MIEKIAFSIIPMVSGVGAASPQRTPGSAHFAELVRRQLPTPFQVLEEAPPTLTKVIVRSIPFRTMSFNIRWDDTEKYAWKDRKERVSSIIHFHKPDLIGLQEPFSNQLMDLVDALPQYECFRGIGLPHEEKGSHAHNPIFYSKERFELLKGGFFFLSPTPDQPTVGWNASILRSVSWVHLKDTYTNKDVYFFNTHFDYFSKLAREESAPLLRQKIEEIAGKKPFIVAGDFNLFPNLGGPETLRLLTEPQGPGRALTDASTVTQKPHHGPTGSWSGFKEAGQPGIKPDFIFIGGGVTVLSHGILADTFDGQYASDHLPVVADLSL